MSEAQKPLVQIGDTIDASGHQAKIIKIEKSGVTAKLTDGSQREVEVALDQIEKAVANQG